MTAQNLARSLYPLLGVMVILTLWQLYTSLSGISPLVLPSPIEIASVSIERYDLLLQQTWPTFVETVLGFALALVIGIPLAVFVANSRLFNLVLYPILVATQSIPKVAIAPIILVWFGLGISSKLALAFLVAFFPIVVDTAAGLAGDTTRFVGSCPRLVCVAAAGFLQGSDAGGVAVHIRRIESGHNSRGDRRGHR